MMADDTTEVNMAESEKFERPLEICEEIYGDDILEMYRGLPALVEQCRRFRGTRRGQNYAEWRPAAFVLASNQLEGTSSPGAASEQETVKVILDFLKSGGGRASEGGIHRSPWNEEGQNTSSDPWYSQCKAHVEALQMMVNLAKEGKPLDADTLLQCHRILMNGAVTERGEIFESRFRSFDEPVSAGDYVFPNLTDHRADLEEKLTEVNDRFETSHPVAWASDLLMTVLTLHPFLNGNGRLARLCFAYGLMRHGVPCAVVFSDGHSKARAHCIRAVHEAQGEKAHVNKYEKLHAVAVTGLFQTLRNMVAFCEK